MRTYIQIPYTIGLAIIIATTSVNAGYWDNYLCSYVMRTAADESLLNAAEDNDTEKAQEAINNGANINVQNPLGFFTTLLIGTPLHIAAIKGNREIAQLLLQNGADPNLCIEINLDGADEDTALHIFIRRRDMQITQLLIANGADVHLQNEFKETPLHTAANQGNTAAAQLLVDNFARVNVQDTKKITPLHYAARYGHLDIARMLIHNDADVHLQNIFKETPLHVAAFGGHTATAHLLIHKGSDVNQRDGGDYTPLANAALKGHTAMARLLIRKGAKLTIHTLKRRIGPTVRTSTKDIANSREHHDVARLLYRVDYMKSYDISQIITEETPAEDREFYAEAMAACGQSPRAHEIIQHYVNNLSDNAYANIMLHAAQNQFITASSDRNHGTLVSLMRDMYEDDSKARAFVNTAWNHVKNGYANTEFIEWLLNNYTNLSRQFCDEDGNTIAHASADAQFNDLLPRIMTIVMANNKHNPRNKDGKTPVMLRRAIGNDTGADAIKNIALLRSWLSPQTIDTRKTRRAESINHGICCLSHSDNTQSVMDVEPVTELSDAHDDTAAIKKPSFPPEICGNIIGHIQVNEIPQYTPRRFRLPDIFGFQCYQ